MHTAPLQGIRYTLAVRKQAGKQFTWSLDVQFHTMIVQFYFSFNVSSHLSLVGLVVCWPASDTVAGRRSSVVGCVAEACSVVVAPGATGPWRATGWPCNWLRGMVCVTGGSDAPVERWGRSRARNMWLAEKLHKSEDGRWAGKKRSADSRLWMWGQREWDLVLTVINQNINFTPLPDIKVKPPGSTTPPDVFNTVPLVVEQGCQEGALLCTCTDMVDEEAEEEEGVDCVVPGRLDMVNDGFIRSCRNR